MAIASFGIGLGIVTAALAAPVSHAPGPVITRSGFDLASVPKPRSTVHGGAERNHRFAKPFHDSAVLRGVDWTPPARQWGDAANGPVVEIGALGSRRKGLPDVVHLSLDWDF